MRARFLAIVIVLVGARVAGADGLDGERFAPSIGVEGTFAVEHPSVAEHKDWGLGLFLNYAKDQIVVRQGNDVLTNVLERAFTGDLVASFGLLGRLEFGFGLPVHFVYEGDGFAAGGDTLAPTSGVGDLRLVPKLALIQDLEPHRRLLLSIGLPITLPTGNDEAARGAGGLTAMPLLMFAYHRTRSIGLGFGVGYKYRAQHPANLPYGDAFVFQPWISYAATDALTLRAELLGEKQLNANVDGADLPIEIVPGLDFRIGSVDLFAGAGIGLTDGVGAPAFRIIGGIRYRHFAGRAGGGGRRVERGTGPDPDDDGIRGKTDRCPNDAEDEDGFEDWDGCPEKDNDRDGVADDVDECPEMPGPRSHEGCPDKTYVKVVSGRLYIFGKVQFATGSAQMNAQSNVVLDQIAVVLRDHPQIRIRIDGHTDNLGGKQPNQQLATQRATAVRAALVQRGAGAQRLAIRGVGEDQPVAPNRTAAGRAKNRRVEFIIR